MVPMTVPAGGRSLVHHPIEWGGERTETASERERLEAAQMLHLGRSRRLKTTVNGVNAFTVSVNDAGVCTSAPAGCLR